MYLLKSRLSAEILVRVVADILLVNTGLFAGLAARLISIAVFQSGSLTPPNLRDAVMNLWLTYQRDALLLTVITLAIFAIGGFYTRGRFYRGRYKALVIVQAVTLAYLLFGFLTYFVPFLTPHPRLSLFASGGATIALIMGARLWSTIWRSIVRREDRRYPEVRTSARIQDVLVIGGAGYIGSILCRQLLAKGHRVRVLDALLYGDEPILPLLVNPDFQFIYGDSRDIEAVVRAMWDVDAVVHLGEIVGDPATEVDVQLSLEINVAATQMIAQAAKGFRCQRFIYMSSCSVYGENDKILNERSQLSPVSLYVQAKIDAERVILGLNDGDFHPVVLRLGTVYGLSPRPRFDLVINLLTAKAVVDGEITIYGGDQWRPFVHVSDAARAIIMTLEAPLEAVKGQIFNVGSDDQNHRISDVGKIIRDLIQDSSLINQDNDVDKRNYRVSFAKIQRQLGYSSMVTVEQGVKEIERAIKSGKLEHYTKEKYSNYKTLSNGNGLLEIRRTRINELYSQPPPPNISEKPSLVSLSSAMPDAVGSSHE